ncbi:hypothetical protein DVV91_10265 [Clostridium botulinum]|uniref:hypothetical protein n=1 Tax=Clostridium botulinum TaxID=1491 RepID=UPI00196818ED|nr:hypothetical protein [Clostridium botulinum]MBN1074726.1 hypothetical protein [Clostridium botulinum]
MRNKLISLLLVVVCSFGLIGCETNILESNNNKENNDIVDTGSKYIVNGMHYDVYYDIHTNIVYLQINSQNGYQNIIPLINSNRQPMTIDEYNESK